MARGRIEHVARLEDLLAPVVVDEPEGALEGVPQVRAVAAVVVEALQEGREIGPSGELVVADRHVAEVRLCAHGGAWRLYDDGDVFFLQFHVFLVVRW